MTSAILSPAHCDPLFIFKGLKKEYSHCALLESADRTNGSHNTFSFIALGARNCIRVQNSECTSTLHGASSCLDPLTIFETILQQHRNGINPDMGYIGFLSFESARYFDTIDLAPDPETPDALFVLPEVLLRIHHANKTVEILKHDDSTIDIDAIIAIIMQSPFFDDSADRRILTQRHLPSLADITNFRTTPREEFIHRVQAVQEKILSGEAFQVVLSQEIRMKINEAPIDIYAELRSINPSPYMYYFETPELTIVGSSPETLLCVTGRQMLYRPIAGTRKRTGDDGIDEKMQRELLSDQKERAEHQMLVDLGRSDIGRVAEIGSVHIEKAFHIEAYAHVYHIVTDITGTLRKGLTSLDALRAVFPAGTLSGAPKLRALEIIRATEKSPRGIYGGAFGYIHLSGDINMAITIRTMLCRNGEISLRTGAGIVKDSIPENEDNECLHKARSCLSAVFSASTTHTS